MLHGILIEFRFGITRFVSRVEPMMLTFSRVTLFLSCFNRFNRKLKKVLCSWIRKNKESWTVFCRACKEDQLRTCEKFGTLFEIVRKSIKYVVKTTTWYRDGWIKRVWEYYLIATLVNRQDPIVYCLLINVQNVTAPWTRFRVRTIKWNICAMTSE